MNPVRGYTMLNFIHWVALHRPEIGRLSDLSEETLLELVNEFERGQLTHDTYLREQWWAGFRFLLNEDRDWEGYAAARYELARLEGR